MMNATMVDFLLLWCPVIALVVAVVGVGWSVLKKRRYLIGFVFLLLGVAVYYYGVHVGKWEGLAISFFIGGGLLLLGLLTLLITFIYSKLVTN